MRAVALLRRLSVPVMGLGAGLLLVGVVTGLAWACGGAPASGPISGSMPGPEAGVAPEVRVSVVYSGEAQPVALTRAASERQRLRAHHATLIASRPTPTVPPTVSAQLRASLHASGQDTSFYGGSGPVSPPQAGVWWYQDAVGDQTVRGVRESNPHWSLFESYRTGSEPAFSDGSMQTHLGRELARQVHDLMPAVGPENGILQKALAENLGWELATEDSALVRLWSDFIFRGPENEPRKYVVGALLSLELKSNGPGGRYLESGAFIGPVLLERR